MPRKPRTRRREKKFVPQGRAYVTATFNNTIITLTDPSGNAIAASSAGAMGFRGSRKSTAFAAQRAGDNAARQAMDQGLRTVDVFIIAASSAGAMGFRGSRKSTAFAAQRAGDNAARQAMDQGLRTVDVYIKGPGAGREAAIRALQSAGVRVVSIKDVTPAPHNGCRPPKKRRV